MTRTPVPAAAPAPRPRPRDGGHLRVDGVSVSFGERRVLTDVSFTVAAGDRTGLIGENGSGKSTLLRVAAGLLQPDAGAVTATTSGSGAARVGLLHQVPPFAPTATVRVALEDAVAPARSAGSAVHDAAVALAERGDDPVAAHAYDAALETADRTGAWEVDSRVEQTLAALGLADVPRDQVTAELSGGQRSRLALAWILLSAPDVLLLDEPTNHLDDAATASLRTMLEGWRGPVLVASHDRAFLDETVTSLVDLDPSPVPLSATGARPGDVAEASAGSGTGLGATRFSGSYTEYLLERSDARERWERQYRDEQAELSRLRAGVRSSQQVGHEGRAPRTEARASRKFYSDRNATVVSRRVNDARARLDDLVARQVRRPPADLVFRGLPGAAPGDAPAGRTGSALVASDVAVAGRLAGTSLTLGATDKLLVTGTNGSGKSTLLSVLAGKLSPTSGVLDRAPGVRVGLLEQEVRIPDPAHRGPGRTARRAYEDLVGTERAARVPLATFGLVAPRDEERPVAVLSVGQQRRLALAVLLADPPDVLLLDEPTNHLSLLLVTQLESTLPAYPGAVVVASHDRWLREAWTGGRLAL